MATGRCQSSRGISRCKDAYNVRRSCVLTRRMERTAAEDLRTVVDPAKFRKQLKTHQFTLFLNMLWHSECGVLTFFWRTVTSNGSPYATGPLSCPSVTSVYCGQTVGWIKMPLGTEVGLGPGHIVLDGDPVPQRKGEQQPPLFGPLCSVTVAHLSNC